MKTSETDERERERERARRQKERARAMTTTPVRVDVVEEREGGYLDVEAEELEDLFGALSRTPEVDIRTRSVTPGTTTNSNFSNRKTLAVTTSVTPKTDSRLTVGDRSRGYEVRGGTRSASATPARRKAIENIQAKIRSGNSVEDLLNSKQKTELVGIACDLLDYIVGRTKILKQEKLLHSFQKSFARTP